MTPYWNLGILGEIAIFLQDAERQDFKEIVSMKRMKDVQRAGCATSIKT
jgi:hypothetical protein